MKIELLFKNSINVIIIITDMLLFIAAFLILLIFHNSDYAELIQQTKDPIVILFFSLLRQMGYIMIVNILCRFIFTLYYQGREASGVNELACIKFTERNKEF